MMEISPIATLGMAVCQISVGSQVAWALASAFLAFLNSALGPDGMKVWGWRVPFVVSLFPGLLAMWGRNRIQETESFLEQIAQTTSAADVEGGQAATTAITKSEDRGVVYLFRYYWPNLLIGFGSAVGIPTMWFVPPFWTLSAVLDAHLGVADSLWIGNA